MALVRSREKLRAYRFQVETMSFGMHGRIKRPQHHAGLAMQVSGTNLTIVFQKLLADYFAQPSMEDAVPRAV